MAKFPSVPWKYRRACSWCLSLIMILESLIVLLSIWRKSSDILFSKIFHNCYGLSILVFVSKMENRSLIVLKIFVFSASLIICCQSSLTYNSLLSLEIPEWWKDMSITCLQWFQLLYVMEMQFQIVKVTTLWRNGIHSIQNTGFKNSIILLHSFPNLPSFSSLINPHVECWDICTEQDICK